MACTWVPESIHTSPGAAPESASSRGLPKVPDCRKSQARPGPETGPTRMVSPRSMVAVTAGSCVFQPSHTTFGFWVWGMTCTGLPATSDRNG